MGSSPIPTDGCNLKIRIEDRKALLMGLSCVCRMRVAVWSHEFSFSPQIKGALEYGITSDDIFWLKESPGKT